MSENVNATMGNDNNKRKRDSLDASESQRLARSPPMSNMNGAMNTNLNASMNGNMHGNNGNLHGYDAHNLNSNGLGNIDQQHIDQQLLQPVADDNTMTAKAALAAHPQPAMNAPENPFDNNGLAHNMTAFGEDVSALQGVQNVQGVHGHNSTAAAVYAAREAQNITHAKPTVGSPEWHTQRKNNHKEVERRRRETINEGINELAKLVPGCEKAKGSILARSVQYIAKLQEDNKNMVDRWDTTQMTTTQAITEISTQNAKLKVEVNRRGNLAMKWLQRCRAAGLDFDDYDDDKDLSQIEIIDGQL